MYPKLPLPEFPTGDSSWPPSTDQPKTSALTAFSIQPLASNTGNHQGNRDFCTLPTSWRQPADTRKQPALFTQNAAASLDILPQNTEKTAFFAEFWSRFWGIAEYTVSCGW